MDRLPSIEAIELEESLGTLEARMQELKDQAIKKLEEMLEKITDEETKTSARKELEAELLKCDNRLKKISAGKIDGANDDVTKEAMEIVEEKLRLALEIIERRIKFKN